MNIGDISVIDGRITRCLCNKPNFKIYACKVEKTKVGGVAKHPIYGTISFKGDIQELEVDGIYEVELEYAGENQYGHQYTAIRASKDRPTTTQQVKNFLSEFISVARADTLVEAYPNIIDMVLNNESIDTSKLKGIKDKTIGQIRNKIIENIGVMEVHKEFSKYNLSYSIIKKILVRYKSVDNAIYQINKNPYKALMEMSGIGFKKADDIALKMNEGFTNSLERMIACVEFFLADYENNGNTYIGLNDLHSECLTLVPESIGFFKVALQDPDIFYEESTGRVARETTRKKEEFIAKEIAKIVTSVEPWDIDTSTFNKVDGFDLTDEQKKTIDSVVNNGVTCLTAPAGAGKSFGIKAIVDMLEENGKKYSIMTPTGKSSLVLANYVKKPVKTIHRSLGYNGEEFDFNEDNKIKSEVIIIDEFSMVSITLFNSLLKAIDTKTTRLLLVFDAYQLNSIGAGNIAHDLLNSEVVSICNLTKIFRYGEGGLMNIATKIRNSERYLDKDTTGTLVFGQNKDYCYIEMEQEMMVNKALGIYKKLLDVGNTLDDIMVVSAKNVGKTGTIVINRAIQNMLHGNTTHDYIEGGNTLFYKGDKVKQNKNNYKAIKTNLEREIRKNEVEEMETTDVFNGMTGIVVQVFKEQIHVRYGEEVIVYFKDDLSSLDLGYAISAHASQGSGVDNVIMLSPRADTYMLSSNLLYVMCTRAKKRVYHIGNAGTVNIAIRKKENLLRNTFLCELLIREREEIN